MKLAFWVIVILLLAEFWLSLSDRFEGVGERVLKLWNSVKSLFRK